MTTRPLPTEPGDLAEDGDFRDHFKVWTEVEYFDAETGDYETLDEGAGDAPTFATEADAYQFGEDLYRAYYGLVEIYEANELGEDGASGADVLQDLFILLGTLGMEVS